MGIINQERFIALATGDKGASLRSEIQRAINAGPGAMFLHRNDRDTLVTCFNQIKQYVCDHGWVEGKLLRPWAIDPDLYKSLDRNEVWWGFEFETGYRGFAERSEAIVHCWDTYDNVCYDSEGEGNAAVEITFAPQERSKFHDGTAQAGLFMRWLSDNRKLTMKGNSTAIGTHINMSAPGQTPENNAKVVKAMNLTLARIPRQRADIGNVRQYMFGRSQLYGGFGAHSIGKDAWTEGKLFRTTYDYGQFQTYVKTCEAFSKAILQIVNFYKGDHEKGSLLEAHYLMEHIPYVANMYEVAFEDAEPVLQWNKADEPAAHQGEYGLDTYKTKCPQTLKEIEKLVIEKREAAEREKLRKENEKKIEAATELMRKEHTALNKAGKRPTNVPEGWEYCEDCELWHDEDANNLYDLNPQLAIDLDIKIEAPAARAAR